MSRTVLISGANRGIGLELVGQFLAQGEHVIATCRKPEQATALNVLVEKNASRAEVIALEVTDALSIQALAEQLQGRPVDLLVNNAGIFGPRQSADPGEWLKVLKVNLIAPYQIALALKPNLAACGTAMIANITSRMGSIADNDSGGAPIYRSSKAGLNAAMKSLAIDWADSGISVVQLHPGWVKTDMGGSNAQIDVQTSASGIRAVIERGWRENLSGRFFHCDGSELPW